MSTDPVELINLDTFFFSMMYRTSNTTQKTARAKIKMPYIKNASWLVIISGNKVFGSAELSGVDSGSGVVELFSDSDAMVDARFGDDTELPLQSINDLL